MKSLEPIKHFLSLFMSQFRNSYQNKAAKANPNGIVSFHYHNRNVNPIISKNGDGENSLFVIQGTIIFPHSRLSSRSKKKFPHSRLRRSWGNFFSLLLLRLSWGNIIVPFMTHREFLFPLLAASPLVREISRPHFLK